MVSVNFQNVNFCSASGVNFKNTAQNAAVTRPDTKKNEGLRQISYQKPVQLRTSLTTRDEKKKYEALSDELSLPYRKKLEFALKSGVLLKNNSNDKSSVLDNLYKIITEERDAGLDKVTILEECLDIIANPYVITQTCEDIPPQYQRQVIGLITGLTINPQKIAETKWDLDNMHTGTCPAASIEFDLATKKTAEFFRMVEGLTSPKHEVVKTINLNSLNDKLLESTWLLKTFKTPHVVQDFNTATVLLKPDDNAIIRARIQNHHRDKGERSIIDVLMQSTLMQLGSRQTYNSLTDKRAPNEWTEEDGGLIDFEKTYVESVVEDKNTTSVIYQEVTPDGKLKGYTKDFKVIKKELLDTLKMGHNIIIGYTWPDPQNGGRLAGHEITIVGYKKNANGEGVFICQDSDDNISKPIEMKESFLLKSIHHAGIPEEIASRDFEYDDSWKVGVDMFQQNRQKKS